MLACLEGTVYCNTWHNKVCLVLQRQQAELSSQLQLWMWSCWHLDNHIARDASSKRATLHISRAMMALGASDRVHSLLLCMPCTVLATTVHCCCLVSATA
jgi:hypothetical protein